MRTKDQIISVWLVPVTATILLLAFWLFGGLLPPMSPTMTAEAVASFYKENNGLIRLSMVIVNLWGIMLIPFYMVIVVQMKRMATPSHVLAYAYLGAASGGGALLALADLFWLMAAFRPERGAQLVQLLNDLAWMTFTAPIGMIVAQNVTLALAVLMDARPKPVFPRWVAHYSIATALLIAPGALAMVFQTGPFAWDGLFAFWIRNSAFAVYIAVMFFVVRAAIKQQALEEGAGV